jgi:hypothetical protein
MSELNFHLGFNLHLFSDLNLGLNLDLIFSVLASSAAPPRRTR